jgi:hypothetical protein
LILQEISRRFIHFYLFHFLEEKRVVNKLNSLHFILCFEALLIGNSIYLLFSTSILMCCLVSSKLQQGFTNQGSHHPNSRTIMSMMILLMMK